MGAGEQAADPAMHRVSGATPAGTADVPDCNSLDWDTVESTGRGTVYSYVMPQHPPMPLMEYPVHRRACRSRRRSAVGVEPARHRPCRRRSRHARRGLLRDVRHHRRERRRAAPVPAGPIDGHAHRERIYGLHLHRRPGDDRQGRASALRAPRHPRTPHRARRRRCTPRRRAMARTGDGRPARNLAARERGRQRPRLCRVGVASHRGGLERRAGAGLRHPAARRRHHRPLRRRGAAAALPSRRYRRLTTYSQRDWRSPAAPTRPHRRPRRVATATAGGSTAPRSWYRQPSWPTPSSSRPRSTTATSASSSSTRTPTASRFGLS